MAKVDHQKLVVKYSAQEKKFQEKADRARHFKEQHEYKVQNKRK